MSSLAANIATHRNLDKAHHSMQHQRDHGGEYLYPGTTSAIKLGVQTSKERKEAIPLGLTRVEEDILRKAKRRAYRLDACLFSCCGLRFGWSSVIALIPAVGDVIDMLLAILVFRTCCRAGLGWSIKAKMLMNIVVDLFIGSVPLLGDMADAAFKCNTKNVDLLDEELQRRGEKRLSQSNPSIFVDTSQVNDPKHRLLKSPERAHRNSREYLSRDKTGHDLEAGPAILSRPPAVKIKRQRSSSTHDLKPK